MARPPLYSPFYAGPYATRWLTALDLKAKLRELDEDGDDGEGEAQFDAQMARWIALLLLNPTTRDKIAVGLKYLNPKDFLASPGAAPVIIVAQEMLEQAGEIPDAPKDVRNDVLIHKIKNAVPADSDYAQEVIELCGKVGNWDNDDYKFVPTVLEEYKAWVVKRAYAAKTFEAYKHAMEGNVDLARQTLDSLEMDLGEKRPPSDFFKDAAHLLRPQANSHFVIAVPSLQAALNNGGPGRGHSMLYLGRTNVGKSVYLCNDAVASACAGQNTLLITLEMSEEEIAERCYSAFTGIPIYDLQAKLADVQSQCSKRLALLNGMGTLRLAQFPSKSISINHIKKLMEELKTKHNWTADVVIVDYLELMLASRKAQRDEPEYVRQKETANDLKALAQRENVLVISATQANREGAKKEAALGLEHVGESYAKTHATDFVIAINQTEEQRAGDADSSYHPRYTLSIEKNRKGPKGSGYQVAMNPRTLKLRDLDA